MRMTKRSLWTTQKKMKNFCNMDILTKDCKAGEIKLLENLGNYSAHRLNLYRTFTCIRDPRV